MLRVSDFRTYGWTQRIIETASLFINQYNKQQKGFLAVLYYLRTFELIKKVFAESVKL